MMISIVFLEIRRLLLFFCLIAAIIGCGKPKQVVKNRANVSGVVTYDGKPLAAGAIAFTSTERTVSTTAMIVDGAYATDRAPLGKNAVTVDTSSIQFGNPAKYVPIPAKYNTLQTSGLMADIKPGTNDNVDFKLEK